MLNHKLKYQWGKIKTGRKKGKNFPKNIKISKKIIHWMWNQTKMLMLY